VISETEFGLIHVAVAPALHRFVVVADLLGIDFFSHTPKLAALSRSLAERPSVAETVPEDFGVRFVQILAERGSLLVAPPRANLAAASSANPSRPTIGITAAGAE